MSRCVKGHTMVSLPAISMPETVLISGSAHVVSAPGGASMHSDVQGVDLVMGATLTIVNVAPIHLAPIPLNGAIIQVLVAFSHSPNAR